MKNSTFWTMPKRSSSSMSSDGPSNKKRLLFISRTTGFGGSEVVILDLLKAIDYEKHIVFLASPADVFSNILSDLKLPVRCLPLTLPRDGEFVHMFFSWIRYFTRLRPDKIIVAEGWFADFSLSVILAAFAVGRGNVWMMALHPAPERLKEKFTARFGIIPRLGLSERARAWLTRGILAVSEGVKDRLVRGYRYSPEKISVIYNGVDTERFSPASPDTRSALRKVLQIPDEAIVLVSAARLDPIKRLDRLIQAFAVLINDHKDLWLLFTGDGPLRDELKDLAQTFNCRENIRFLGHVEDVRAILRASDIYVLPSDEEGFGIALIEAMACELVCVATKTIGPCEIIENGRNGFLTERTYEGVLTGLYQALKLGQKERAAIGNCARQRVLEKFRVEDSVAKGLAFMEISKATGAAP